MRTMALDFLVRGKQVVLLYGSRSQEDAAFLQELQGLAAAHPGRFKLVFSASGKAGSWTGRTGRVDKGLIEEQVCTLSCRQGCCGMTAVGRPPLILLPRRDGHSLWPL